MLTLATAPEETLNEGRVEDMAVFLNNHAVLQQKMKMKISRSSIYYRSHCHKYVVCREEHVLVGWVDAT